MGKFIQLAARRRGLVRGDTPPPMERIWLRKSQIVGIAELGDYSHVILECGQEYEVDLIALALLDLLGEDPDG